MGKKSNIDITIPAPEIEDGSDVHMAAEKPEVKIVKIAQFTIKDEFVKAVEAALGSLPYNHKVQIVDNNQIYDLTIGSYFQMIKDNVEKVDITTLNFICNCLTYYPYNTVHEIVDGIRDDQTKYFTEIEPKEIEVPVSQN